jgi:SAM-dependent methyltransferase
MTSTSRPRSAPEAAPVGGVSPVSARTGAGHAVRKAAFSIAGTDRGRSFVYRLLESTRVRRWRRHPIDARYRIDTGGTVPPFVVASHNAGLADVGPYAGCQPSSLRSALAAIDASEDATFYDLGCGKGRAVVVAIERGYRRIVGVDLSRELIAVARKNVDKVLTKADAEPDVELEKGDATAVDFTGREIVVFVYHAFGRATLQQVVERLEEAGEGADVWFVYENPVHFDVLDSSTRFDRWFGETVVCDPDELRHHGDGSEAVAVWHAGPRASVSPHRTDFEIVVTKPGWRAEVSA